MSSEGENKWEKADLLATAAARKGTNAEGLVAAAQVAGVVAADGCGGDCLWCGEEQERGWGWLMAATR